MTSARVLPQLLSTLLAVTTHGGADLTRPDASLVGALVYLLSGIVVRNMVCALTFSDTCATIGD